VQFFSPSAINWLGCSQLALLHSVTFFAALFCIVSVKLQDVSAAISATSSATITSAAICLLTHDVMVSAQLQYDSSLVLCQLKCYLKAQQQLISCQLRCTRSVSNQ